MMVVREAVAMEIPAVAEEEGMAAAAAATRVPPRIRRRLLEGSRAGAHRTSAEEIEARLRDAELRRQQFHDWLACKARKKPRSPSWSSQEDDQGQRLEAKLQAAEQKRLSLLTKAQNRLAKLDEIRQAAKSVVEMRIEKEREELETRVESRVRQAEENRTRLLHAHMQRRAAMKERTSRSLVKKATSESKYMESVRSAILQKRAAAEKKRLALLEAEKRKTQARLLHVQRAAETVCTQRETERKKLEEQLESRLQRAKRQRAEYLKQRGSPKSSAHADYIKHGDYLSRKLARCWRRFVKSSKTTLALAQAYDALGINEKSVKSMPFEKLAMSMESPAALQTTKALLDRLERRLVFSQSGTSSVENIDHLLKRLGSPKRKAPPSRTRVAAKKASRSSETTRLPRYSLRVVLCAYMILAHPGAVLSGQGEREKLLMESAASFVKEFELLVKTILDGPGSAPAAESSSDVTGQTKFRTQLTKFDKAWSAYLYRFVVWKLKDARSLEEDLVRAACKLELSMMQTCKLTVNGQSQNLSHDMKAIQKQVTDDQNLLREKVQHLSGDAGIERMNSALTDTRSKFFEVTENGTPLATPVANVSTPLSVTSSGQVPPSEINQTSSITSEGSSSSVQPPSDSVSSVKLPTENEQMVNEMLHENVGSFAGNSDNVSSVEKDFQARVRETMEKAFWDMVTDSMRGDKPDYSQLINLVKEVRDSLHELAYKGLKEEILENIDLEILSQVLESGSQDVQYLGQILHYSLDMVRKLSAPAKEDEMKRSHEKLLSELAASSEANDNGISSFVIAVIKGLRFTLEEIKELQAEVSKARIQLMQPIIQGTAGVEYLQKAFADRYGPPSNAPASLPIMLQWISATKSIVDAEWSEYLGSLSVLSAADHAQPVVVLRAGHGAPGGTASSLSGASSSGLPECKGDKLDKLIKIGLLQLISRMEGLQMQTIPESFQLNLMRLRAVQGQFQKVIVIATSMLVMRQILMSENSKTTPQELENVISELFKALVKLLDNFPDAGSEEIVEAMIISSASLGSLSDEKTQTRRQMVTRVLLKSLQAGDTVYNKVSRLVYCAFRGVILGGSGAKGQKLADAALRRIGASKLGDRVVKAAEVLIKMATVSEKVHVAWYKALA